MKNYRIIYRITDTEQSSLLSAAALKILQELKLIFGIILQWTSMEKQPSAEGN